MKKLTFIAAIMLSMSTLMNTYAQQKEQSSVPHAFKYQAIARDNQGQVMANQSVSFRISVLAGDPNGTVVYEETQTATTNQFGLANLSIGKGNVVNGNFDNIQWGEGNYYLKVEFDPKGGNDYVSMGTSQLLSVPYAMYAEKAGNSNAFPLKVALQGTNLPTPLSNPETGSLVYNTDSAGTAPYNVIPGYYYNSGTAEAPKWILMSSVGTSGSTDRILVVGTNTTYGGTTLGAAGANATTAPSGSDNTAFGSYTFNSSNTSTNPSGSDNSAVGYKSMNSITTGNYNTAVGSQSLQSGTTLTYNTAVGYFALNGCTTGFENTAVGQAALGANQVGQENSAVGANALRYATGDGNTAIGGDALYTNTSGEYNSANGFQALYYNSTGTKNVAIGDGAMHENSLGSSNTALGAVALYQMGASTSGASYNTAVGDSALYNNTAYSSTATGYAALVNNTSGLHNTANGYKAIYTSSGASGNTAMGYEAMLNNTTGDRNIAIGDSAMLKNTTGNDNIAIGQATFQDNNNTGNYNIAIGNASLATNSSGSRNTGCGFQTLDDNTTGVNNTAGGFQSILYNATGSSNTAYGAYTLYVMGNATSGASYNTALGDSALYNNTTGTENSSTGYGSMLDNTTGVYNTANGYYALPSNTTSSSNAAMGKDALYDNTTGSWNTAVGDSALYNNHAFNGYNNTAIGYQAALSGTGGTTIHNSTVIGVYAKVGESNALVLGGTGNNYVDVGIGTSLPKACLHLVDANGGVNSNCHIKTENVNKPTKDAGTTGTYTVTITNASDDAGTVTVNTAGNAGSAIIDFNKSYNVAPIVVICAANSTAAVEISRVFVTSATGSFTLNFGTGTTAVDHVYNYHVIETASN